MSNLLNTQRSLYTSLKKKMEGGGENLVRASVEEYERFYWVFLYTNGNVQEVCLPLRI